MSHHAPLILDIAGKQLTAADSKRLKHPLTGGVILFGRNWANRQQLTQLCADIKAVRQDLLICVDHEGGRVKKGCKLVRETALALDILDGIRTYR